MRAWCPAPAAHLDQFDGANDLVNWQGNANAQLELRGIVQWIPKIDLAGTIKYPFKSKPPLQQIGDEGITENLPGNVEIGLGAKVDIDRSTFIKMVGKVDARKHPDQAFKDRLVFKTGVTTKVQKTKVCCGVAVKREAQISISTAHTAGDAAPMHA